LQTYSWRAFAPIRSLTDRKPKHNETIFFKNNCKQLYAKSIVIDD
jgi:hypothetical protein